MKKRGINLPEDADVNKSKKDIQFQHQDEFDDPRKEELNQRANNEQEVRNKEMEASQTRHEDKIQPEKKKQSEKMDKINRKLPQIKK
jgi:hypothetical protein